MFLITVKGEIIANDKMHYAQNWVCKSIGGEINNDYFDYDRPTKTVKNDLILKSDIRAVPYAVYLTEKGIRLENNGNGDIYCAPGAMAAELCYKSNISEIETTLNVEVSKEIELYFYNGLLTGIFSILELFLSDVILCLIFTNQEVYERTVEWLLTHNKIKRNNINDIKIQEYFTEKIVYHRFDCIEKMFKDIIHIQFPDTDYLKNFFLPKRNNISHRFGFSNIDRMRMTVINIDILKRLILHCNQFVEKLIAEINSVYYQKD